MNDTVLAPPAATHRRPFVWTLQLTADLSDEHLLKTQTHVYFEVSIEN